MWLVNHILNKAILIVSIALLLLSQCYAQTFSKRANDYGSVYYSAHNQPYGYQTMGRAFDTIGGQINLSTFVRNFDFHGNELETKVYSFPNGRHLNPNYDVNTRLNDTTTVYIVIDKEANNDTIFNTVVWLHNNGDTIKTKRFHSPLHQDGVFESYQFLPSAVTTSLDGQFIYFATYVGTPPIAGNNFIIKKLTSDGDEVWTYINPAFGNYGHGCNALRYHEGKLWFISVGQYFHLKTLNDDAPVLIDDIDLHPNDNGYLQANDMVLDNEGIAFSSVYLNGPGNTKPVVFHIDLEGNPNWQATPDNAEFGMLQDNEHIVQSQDGGYVSCSVKYEEAVINGGDNWGEKIWLWKVDADGELQWQRFYEYLTFDSAFHLVNVAFDLKTTPDGGYIMSGESTTFCPVWPGCEGVSQQGWILKVDACGCLVPGCDEECTVGIQKFKDSKIQRFKIGPNPVRDMLNIYISQNPTPYAQNLSLAVHDTQGNLIKTFQLKNYDTTYVIDASSLAAGQYVLSLVSDGLVLQTERIVVMK